LLKATAVAAEKCLRLSGGSAARLTPLYMPWTNAHTVGKNQDMNHENKLERNQNRIKVTIISSLLNSIKNLGNWFS
jgi:hypothetical protein